MKWKTEYYESKRGEDGYFHIIYKVINKINNKYYIGVHNTKDLGDGYKGSGVVLGEAYKKYGKKSFNYEILEFFNTDKEAYERESEIVNESLVNDPLCYNVMLGGKGNKTGRTPMRNIETGEIKIININEYYNNDVFVSVNKGYMQVYDSKKDQYVRIKTKDFDVSIHTPIHKGKIVLFNKTTNEFEQVSVNDPRRKTGELVSMSKNKVTVTDGNGNWCQVDKNHPDYISGKLKTCSKNRWTLRNKNTKECISVEKGSDVDWSIYEFATCRLRNENNPNLIHAKLVGSRRCKYYDKEDERFKTYDLLPYKGKGYRKIYFTNGNIDVALHESEIDNFLKYHPDWYKGHKKYNYNPIKLDRAWVNNGVQNKIIKKGEIENFLSNNPGWKRGCLFKNRNNDKITI